MSALGPAGLVRVQFQLGLFREEVRVPAGDLSYAHAKRLAAEIIERKVPFLASRTLTLRESPVGGGGCYGNETTSRRMRQQTRARDLSAPKRLSCR